MHRQTEDNVTKETAVYRPERSEPYSPAEVCEIARNAHRTGIRNVGWYVHSRPGNWPGTDALCADAADLYPTPYVERARVVADAFDMKWRVVDGHIEMMGLAGWRRFNGGFLPESTRLILADLLTTPTERVSAEVGHG